MTADEFLALERLPTAAEFVELCDALGVEFAAGGDGRPVLRGTADDRAIRRAMAKVLGREPWRSQVLALKGMNSSKPDKSPADFQASDPATKADTEKWTMPPALDRAKAGAVPEVLTYDGKILPMPAGWTPDAGGVDPAATYWRGPGELGWRVLPLRPKEGAR